MPFWLGRLTALVLAMLIVAAFAALGVLLGRAAPGEIGYYPTNFTPPALGTPWPQPRPLPTQRISLPLPLPSDVITP